MKEEVIEQKQGGVFPMGKIIKYVLGFGFLLVLGIVLVYAGITIWSCIGGQNNPNQPDIPKVDEASYSVQIKNTGNLIFTDDYELIGNEAGKRVFILHGFWEMRGQDFVYKDTELILDEAIFGEITVKRRK